MNSSLSKYFLLLFAASCIGLIQCSKEKRNPACPSTFVNATSSISHPCAAQGTITVTSPIGSNWQYRIGNAAFESSPFFANLLPGSYVIIAKDENNCTVSSNIDVASIQPGPLFSEVKSLLAANCTTCHGSTNPQAGLNWGSNCDILNFWDRIKARAVDGNPSPMPQGGLLPASERNKITAWVNAGHRFTD